MTPEEKTEEVSDKGSSDEVEICLRQLGSQSSLKVMCHIDNVQVLAVVDTAADVTIISEDVYRQLTKTPACLKKVPMKCAGIDQVFTAKKIGPVKLQVGKNSLDCPIYVAPIRDRMLLGIDVLRALEVNIDLSKEKMRFKDSSIPFWKPDGCTGSGNLNPIPLRLVERLTIPAEAPVSSAST